MNASHSDRMQKMQDLVFCEWVEYLHGPSGYMGRGVGNGVRLSTAKERREVRRAVRHHANNSSWSRKKLLNFASHSRGDE